MSERLEREVARELARLGGAPILADLLAAWPDATGPLVARHAWPARVARDGTLHVATDSSVWAFELTQLAPTILERLRAALGAAAPSGLRFAPGRLPEPGRTAGEGPTAAPPTPTSRERELARALSAGIGDGELRELVARAAAASLARPASDR